MSFVADFEAYMPAFFNEQSYGKLGVLATLDEAGIDACILFIGDVLHYYSLNWLPRSGRNQLC